MGTTHRKQRRETCFWLVSKFSAHSGKDLSVVYSLLAWKWRGIVWGGELFSLVEAAAFLEIRRAFQSKRTRVGVFKSRDFSSSFAFLVSVLLFQKVPPCLPSHQATQIRRCKTMHPVMMACRGGFIKGSIFLLLQKACRGGEG